MWQTFQKYFSWPRCEFGQNLPSGSDSLGPRMRACWPRAFRNFLNTNSFYFMGALNVYFKWKLKINLCFNNYYSFSVLLYVYVREKVKLRARGSEFFSSQKFWSIYFAFLKRKRINKRKCYRNWCVSGLWYMVGTEMAVDHGNSPPPPPFHLLPHQPTLITLASSNHFFP